MDIMTFISGNIFSLLAMLSDSASSTRKTTKGILWVQNLSQVFYCVGSIILKGYSSAAQNVVSIIRNFVAIKKINSKELEWILIALGVVLGVVFNNLGPVGYLPVVANLQYTLVMFKFKDNERALKISFVVCNVLFMVFNQVILNFVGVISNIVVMTATLISIFRKK